MRRAARRDANEPELVKAARKLGAHMQMGPPLDWWCGWRGKWIPTEVKNPLGRNRLTPAQIEFREECDLLCLPMWTWRTIGDVLDSLTEGRNER